MQSKTPLRLKFATFALYILAVLALFYYLRFGIYRFSSTTFSYIGLASFVIAFIASFLSLIKYVTRKKDNYIFVTVGLLGASLLDFYFLFYGSFNNPENLGYLNNSAFFLSIFLFLSWCAWYFRDEKDGFILTRFGALIPVILGVILLVFCAIIPTQSWFTLIFSAVIFLLVLTLYLLKKYWTYKYFEYFFIFALISFFLSQSLFLPFSLAPRDTMQLASEVINLVGYSFSLIGLLLSSFNAFSLVETLGKTAEARLQASVKELPLGYILLDDQAKILIKNDILLKLLGNEIKNDIWLKNALRIKERIRDISETNKLVIEELEANELYLKLYYTPVFLSTRYAGMVVLVQDITQEKLLNKTKDEFIALASHELRTPITLIKGNTELIQDLLAEKTVNKKEITEMISDVYSSSLKLLSIAEQFLDVSNLEQEKAKFKNEEFDLAEVVVDCVKTFSEKASTKGLYLKVDRQESDKFLISSDKQKLGQVIDNLLDNAIKFTEKGGITIHLLKEDQKAILEVQDTGLGIKEYDQKMLFKKFQQVGDDFYKHDSTQGVGLGLYISKMIVDRTVGSITLKSSEAGKGSVFQITYPLIK